MYEKRVQGLDALKCLCAFLVVCIHIPFGGDTYGYFTALTRCAVPIFFMITGYFYQTTMDKNKVSVQIIKILKLFLIANGIYILFLTINMIFKGSLSEWLIGLVSAQNLLKFFVLNWSPFSAHLWYLQALLYVLLFVAFWNFLSQKFSGNKLIGGGIENYIPSSRFF